MKRGSALAALLLAALLCLGLTACDGGLTATEATVYVQGLLDRTYLGQYNEDYMKLVDTDEASMEARDGSRNIHTGDSAPSGCGTFRRSAPFMKS